MFRMNLHSDQTPYLNPRLQKNAKPSSNLSTEANNPGVVCWRNHRGNNQSSTENSKPGRGAKLLPQCTSFFHLQLQKCLEGRLFIILIVMSCLAIVLVCLFGIIFHLNILRGYLFSTLMRVFFHCERAEEKTENSFLWLDKQRIFP